MRKICFREWEFEIDDKKPFQNRENLNQGDADSCTCNYCKNYRRQRSKAFPEEIKILFETAGIDLNKEFEVSHVYKLENGLHHYAGRFHFAGKIIGGKICKDSNSVIIEMAKINENFWIGFREANQSIYFKSDIPLIELEFWTNLPWLIEEPDTEE